MDQVYKGALCNIAATFSPDSGGGLFHERHGDTPPQIVITKDGEQQILMLVDNALFEREIEGSPLAKVGGEGEFGNSKLTCPRGPGFSRNDY